MVVIIKIKIKKFMQKNICDLRDCRGCEYQTREKNFFDFGFFGSMVCGAVLVWVVCLLLN